MIGVSAVRQDGTVPDYSNRDAVYNDLAAPGDAIFSTIPAQLVQQRPPAAAGPSRTAGHPTSSDAIGTSFAAPQVSAAAALLLGQDPSLRPEQVAWLLERSAADASAATGCVLCGQSRDAYTGWGTLDVARALDDAHERRAASAGRPPRAERRRRPPGRTPCRRCPGPSTATLDYWDDQNDVYRLHLRKGQRLYARLDADGLRDRPARGLGAGNRRASSG